MLVYSDIIKEACCFYSSLCPTATVKAKLSLANFGRTIVEKYPTTRIHRLKRHDGNDRFKTKAGQEPYVVILLNDDSTPNKLFIVGDTMQIAEEDFVQALLLLFAVYYLMDLNYLQQFADFGTDSDDVFENRVSHVAPFSTVCSLQRNADAWRLNSIINCLTY